MLLGWIAAIKATGISLSSIALIEVTRALNLAPSTRSIAASVVSLTIGATAIAAGVAADRIGRRRLLMLSFVLTAAANIVVALAPNATVFILGQALAGVGYGIMFTGSYAYVKAVAPAARLGWFLGLFGLFTSLVTAMSSITGSFLGDADWRMLFLLVPGMCLVGFLLTPRLLPVMPKVGDGPVDVLGLVLIGAGVVLFISGVTRVAAKKPDTLGVSMLAIGLAALVAWVLWEKRTAHPSFPISIFKSGPYVGAALVGVMVNVVSGSIIMSMSDVWQYIGQYSVLGVDLSLQPLFLVGTLGGLGAGHLLSSGVSPRVVIATSLLVTAAGCALVLPATTTAPYTAFLPGIVLMGVGMAAAITAQGQVFIHCAPPSNYGAVTSSKTSFGQIGSALGLVFAVLFVDRLFDAGVVSGLEHRGDPAAQAQAGLSGLESYIHTGKWPQSADTAAIMQTGAQALQHSYVSLMLACIVLLTLTAAGTWRLMREKPAPAPH